MGRLAEAAGAPIKGAVMVCFADGTGRTFESEQEAEAAILAGASIEYRRGAFHVGEAATEPETTPDPDSDD